MKQNLIKWLFVAMLAWTPISIADDFGFVEGVDYELIEPAQPTSTGDKIEVVEMFWYGCPHCFHFEPNIKKWLETKPENVEFVRIPAIFNPRWALLARAYYTAEILEISERIHEPLFNAIHLKKRRFNKDRDVERFFVEQGVDRSTFKQAFNSFSVDWLVRRAYMLTERYGIQGVPAMVINGKYRSASGFYGGNDRLIEMVNHLIAEEAE